MAKRLRSGVTSLLAAWTTLRNCRPFIHTKICAASASGGSGTRQAPIDLASRVSVPRGSLRKIEESESFILASDWASVAAMVKEKGRDYVVSEKGEGAVMF